MPQENVVWLQLARKKKKEVVLGVNHRKIYFNLSDRYSHIHIIIQKLPRRTCYNLSDRHLVNWPLCCEAQPLLQCFTLRCIYVEWFWLGA